MREKLIEILRKPIFPHELVDPTEAVADYLLDNDVVPVVRCRDCKKSEGGLCPFEGVYPWKTMDDDGFCSFGERKEGRNV